MEITGVQDIRKKVVDQMTGFGKLAFSRTLWPEILPSFPHLKLYHHTGVTLFRQDWGVDLVDVKKEDKVVSLTKRNVTDMMNEHESTKMFFDNRCLRRRGAIDPKKTLFRLARILNKTNCDHMSTWILTGTIAWTTALVRLDPIIPLPTFPGEVDESVLREIEEQLEEPATRL